MFDLAEELKRNNELKEDDVNNIKAWIAKQPHLPKVTDEMIVLFLHSCYYKIEATKITIENYYTIRTEALEIFTNRNPCSEEVKEFLETMYVAQLPRKTSEKYDVFISKLCRSDVKFFNGNTSLKVFNMLGDVCYRKNGPSAGVIYIIDMDGSSLSHILKFNITSLRHNFFYLQEAFPVRLKGIHLINSASFVTVFMNMIKPFVSSEILGLMYFHDPGSESIYNFVSKSILPKEYGGDSPSLTELQVETKKLILENEAWFKEEESLRVDESKRAGRPKQSFNTSSLEGSFKKIEID